jgi:hypothetical protein
MSNSSPSPVRPLNVGNVVSAGLVLYRSNLKQYFNVSLKANLWALPSVLAFVGLYFLALLQIFRSALGSSRSPGLEAAFEVSGLTPILQLVERFSPATPILVPVLLLVLLYCSAKYLANSALISRLAFQELSDRPESLSDARPKVMPRMWAYLWVGIGIGLRLLAIYFLIAFPGITVISILSGRPRSAPTQSPLFFLLVAVILYALLWFYSRWVISEVPLAVESGLSSSQSIKRSWDLTASAVGRVQVIVFVAFLVTIPILAVTNYLPDLLLSRVPQNSEFFWIVFTINLLIGMLGSVLMLPFWQSIKAVMYYDLRSRREGIDLQLRDR